MRRGALVALLWVVAGAATARAEDEFVPAPKRSLLLLRALLYDRSLGQRLGPNARFVVLFKEGLPESETDRDQMLAALRELSAGSLVAGKPLVAEAVAFRSEGELEAAVRRAPTAAVYVCRGLHGQLSGITAALRRARVLSAAGVRQAVEDGLTLGVVVREGRARLVVNRRASRQEGVDFEAGLLGIAEVIDR